MLWCVVGMWLDSTICTEFVPKKVDVNHFHLVLEASHWMLGVAHRLLEEAGIAGSAQCGSQSVKNLRTASKKLLPSRVEPAGSCYS